MNYLETKLRIERAPALRLLRADNAALCIGFLRDVFRVDRAISRPQHELISRLTHVLDEVNGTQEPKEFPRAAKDYIDKWVADGALVTRYGDDDTIVYELTPEADQAILFYQQLGEQRQDTRGAQSKLRTVMESLERIYRGANPDKDRRLDEIRQEITALENERIRLLSNQQIEPDSPEKLMEEYQFALDMAQALLADFTRIRQLFMNVAQELAERYASADTTRGVLLERAINAHKELHNGPLGKSFSGFREYLNADETQSRLRDLIESIETIPALMEEMHRDRFLARMPANLIAEAKAVITQTRRLSSDLRRMLDASAITSRREVQEILGDIKALAYSMADNPPVDDLVLVYLPSAELTIAEQVLRAPWRPPEMVDPVRDSKPFVSDQVDQAIQLFANLSAVDIPHLLSLLKHRFDKEDNAFRLTEMLEWHPPRPDEWLLDVVGYLEIAKHPRSKHVIKNGVGDRWQYTPPGSSRSYNLPQIYFFK